MEFDDKPLEEIIATLEKKLADDFVKITSLHIKVGAFSGVVLESLQFGLELILKERDLTNTRVKLLLVPAKVKCELILSVQIFL